MKTVRRKSRATVRTDQRINRSDVPMEAARLYLEAAAARGGARALALGNDDGLLVTGTMGAYDLDGLAALGAACLGGEGRNPKVDRMMENIAGEEDIYAVGVTIQGSTFCLTSIGARVRSVKDATAALTRILSPARGSAPPPG